MPQGWTRCRYLTLLSYSTYSFIWLLYFLPFTLRSGRTAGTIWKEEGQISLNIVLDRAGLTSLSLSDWSLSLLLSMSPLYCLRYFL